MFTTPLHTPHKEILKSIHCTISEYGGDRLKEIIVFGSVARGEARQDSDIDMMMIVSALSPHDREFIATLCADVLLRDGIVLSLFCRTHEEFAARPFNPLFRNICRESVVL